MSNYLLLRFRNLIGEFNTIEEHNKISEQNKTVWWGWWKKPRELMPDTALERLKLGINENDESKKIYLIDSATDKVYLAIIHEILFDPTNELVAPTDRSDTVSPEYYRDKKLPAWFRIGNIKELGKDKEVLHDFVWSNINRTWNLENQNRINSKNALPESLIGERVTETDFLDSNISLWFITPINEIELTDKSYVVDNLSSTPWQVKGNFIIHLSDLHFGARHAYRNQLASKTGSRIAKESLVDQLLQDFEIMSLDDKNVALLVVTGDLTWEGNVHEFANAKDFLQNLGRNLDLHPSQIIVVPGNHDIEWMEGKEDLDSDAELNYRNFCREFYNTRPSSSFLRIHRFNIAGKNTSIIGLNSCRLESKSNAGLGYVGREQIREMLRFIHQDSISDLKIALTHHHLLPVNFIEEIDWDQKRVSLMLDADDVLRSLICAKTRMVLHGHQHQPYFSEIRRIVQDYVNPFNKNQENPLNGQIAVVGGGSIGVERSHINFVGRNTYNIINLSYRDEKTGISQIEVNTRMQSSVGPGFLNYQTAYFDI